MRIWLLGAVCGFVFAAAGGAVHANMAPPEPEIMPVVTDAPAGDYRVDPAHADLTFRIDHIGMSKYTARFSRFEADLAFDPADTAAMRVTASIDVASLLLPSPPEGFLVELLAPAWLNASDHPAITFQSTSVALNSPSSAVVTGDLTLLGVTKQVVLNVTFNGGYAGHMYEPNARIGFSARGTFMRSDFGMTIGLPPPGSTMGVGDEIEVIIEAEFTGPPWAGAGTEAPAATPDAP